MYVAWPDGECVALISLNELTGVFPILIGHTKFSSPLSFSKILADFKSNIFIAFLKVPKLDALIYVSSYRTPRKKLLPLKFFCFTKMACIMDFHLFNGKAEPYWQNGPQLLHLCCNSNFANLKKQNWKE